MYNLEKKRSGGDRRSQDFQKTQNGTLIGKPDTADRIAREVGVGKNTVKRAGQFASAVDALSENEPKR